MQRDSEPIVLEICGGGRVVAIVVSGTPVDDVLRRAIEEAASRAGELVVIQLIGDRSVVRRALAKAILARGLTAWSHDVAEIDASDEVMDDSTVNDPAVFVRGAACILMSARTACSGGGMAVLRRRVPELVSP